jgi:hypothetical protein
MNTKKMAYLTLFLKPRRIWPLENKTKIRELILMMMKVTNHHHQHQLQGTRQVYDPWNM